MSARRTVVMLVANDVSIDVRVRKMAASVARNDDVVVLGLARGSHRSECEMDGFKLILVPGVHSASSPISIRRIVGRTLLVLPGGRRLKSKLAQRRHSKKVTPVIVQEESPAHLPWREVLKETQQYEVNFGAVLDEFEADIVHAQDVHLISVAAAYVARRQAAGADCVLIYDSHEYIRGLGTFEPQRRNAYAELEDEFIASASGVITVSDSIAENIQRDHSLRTKPSIVLNAPSEARIKVTSETPSIRRQCKLADGIPLAVYSGGIHITRGMDLLVSSLEFAPDIHLAMTSNRESWYIEHLRNLASQIGAADRLHFVPYVSPEDVVPFLSSATIGVSPLPANIVNADLALPNKLFDYIQAELPLVVSNCFEVTKLMNKFQLGELFQWDDVKDLGAKMVEVVENLDTYKNRYALHREALRAFTWEAQEPVLQQVYSDALKNPVKIV